MTIEAYWTAIGTAGLEHLILDVTSHSITANGVVLRQHNGIGVRLQYRLTCLSDLRLLALTIRSLAIDGLELSLTSDRQGRWHYSHGEEIVDLRGCETVDIMATPFTNTLAIQQLSLSVGESKEIDVVFVTIPNLNIERHRQRYCFLRQRDDKACYLYENLNSYFKAELWVDRHSLVTTYANVWQRV
jgi:uncharacterized protein